MTETSEDLCLEAILEEKPAAIWFAFDTDLGKYVVQVHAFDNEHEHKTVIFVMVNTIEDALHAANKCEVDVIVAQGNKAGRHGDIEVLLLLYLLMAVKHAVPNGPMSIDRHTITALITMGADGVVLST
ncbi:hypothetical protein H0H87_009126 [Tephrocybe sp. NHM501043]|nr:hypothetical protein H0H87_009126 [Tephrocybe sp. NHM501043]